MGAQQGLMAGRQQALNSGTGLGLIDSTKDSITGTANQPFTLYRSQVSREALGAACGALMRGRHAHATIYCNWHFFQSHVLWHQCTSTRDGLCICWRYHQPSCRSGVHARSLHPPGWESFRRSFWWGSVGELDQQTHWSASLGQGCSPSCPAEPAVG